MSEKNAENGTVGNTVPKNGFLSTILKEKRVEGLKYDVETNITRKGVRSVAVCRLLHDNIRQDLRLGNMGHYRLPGETDEEFEARAERLENIISEREASRVAKVRALKAKRKQEYSKYVRGILKHLSEMGIVPDKD